MTPRTEGNSNIQVQITDASEFYCFRLTLNPKAAPLGELSSCCGVPAIEATPGVLICAQCAQRCEVEIPSTGRIEVTLHARSLVDLIHKCSEALCEWQQQTLCLSDLIAKLSERSAAEAK